jgi:molybdate transport system ATP-binding protein
VSLHVAFRVRRGRRTISVDLEVASGEVVALLGPNGAGKTTILEAIAGVVPIDEGTIELDGKRIDAMPAERRGVGLAFQDGMLFPRMSVVDNVAFSLRARGVRAREARAAARPLLARIAPSVEPDALPARLSGGERQRVALARALAPAPAVLLLDEPLAAVDASARPALRDAIHDALAGFAGPAIIVSHDPVEAMTLADRLALLEEGSITQIGTPADVRTHPRTRYAADLVGVNLFEGTLVPQSDGSGLLETKDGAIAVAWPERLPREATQDVQATVAPAEIAVHAARPEGSARNVFPGRIVEIVPLGGRARLRLASSPPLVAEVTTGSVDRMALVAGADVWASCKAVEVRLMVAGVRTDTL